MSYPQPQQYGPPQGGQYPPPQQGVSFQALFFVAFVVLPEGTCKIPIYIYL